MEGNFNTMIFKESLTNQLNQFLEAVKGTPNQEVFNKVLLLDMQDLNDKTKLGNYYVPLMNCIHLTDQNCATVVLKSLESDKSILDNVSKKLAKQFNKNQMNATDLYTIGEGFVQFALYKNTTGRVILSTVTIVPLFDMTKNDFGIFLSNVIAAMSYVAFKVTQRLQPNTNVLLDTTSFVFGGFHYHKAPTFPRDIGILESTNCFAKNNNQVTIRKEYLSAQDLTELADTFKMDEYTYKSAKNLFIGLTNLFEKHPSNDEQDDVIQQLSALFEHATTSLAYGFEYMNEVIVLVKETDHTYKLLTTELGGSYA